MDRGGGGRAHRIPLETVGRLEDTSRLEHWLRARLNGELRVEVISRSPNEYTSTYPSEVVQCRIAGTPLKLLIKWCSLKMAADDPRSGGGLYEIQVYRRVLAGLPLSLPPLLATWVDHDIGEGCLILEYLDGARRLFHARGQLATMEAAARWIGEFHSIMLPRVDDPEFAFLRRLDGAEYEELLRILTDELARRSDRPKWLMRLGADFDWLVTSAIATDPTIIHGEYYPTNVLVHSGRVLPVDWETAAVGHGAVDLAMLLDGWKDAIVEHCLRTYWECRFGRFDAADARQWLATGAVLTNLQWLGRRIRRNAAGSSLASCRRLERLRVSAMTLGVA